MSLNLAKSHQSHQISPYITKGKCQSRTSCGTILRGWHVFFLLKKCYIYCCCRHRRCYCFNSRALSCFGIWDFLANHPCQRNLKAAKYLKKNCTPNYQRMIVLFNIVIWRLSGIEILTNLSLPILTFIKNCTDKLLCLPLYSGRYISLLWFSIGVYIICVCSIFISLYLW